MPPTSTETYDQFASNYRHYSEKKSRYIDAINRLIVSRVKRSKNVLDIGCGDGVRGVQISRIIKPEKLLMIDSSREMVKLAARFQNGNIIVQQLDIVDRKAVTELRNEKFDVIFCLWNVFGHIITEQKRTDALLNIKNLLSEDGVMFVDVSNRYNVSYYGIVTVAVNLWNDLMHPNQDNGTFLYEINVDNEKKVPSHCHFFSLGEFPKLCNEVGLQVIETIYINYETGITTNRFGGHAFYVVKRKPLAEHSSSARD